MTEADIRSQSFRLTRADYIAYYVWVYWRSYTRFPMALFAWIVVLTSCSGLIVGDLQAGRYVTAGLILAGVAAFWFVIVPGLGLVSFLGSLSRTHNAYLPRVAVVYGAHFTVEGDGFADHRSWPQFRQVIVSNRLIYLSLNFGTGMIVPKSAFPTLSERDAFVAACRRHIAGSRHIHAGVVDAPILMLHLPTDGVETEPFKLGFYLYSMQAFVSLLHAFTRPIMWAVAACLLGPTLWSHWSSLVSGDFSSLVGSFVAAGLWLVIFIPTMVLLSWGLARNKPIMRNSRRVVITPDNIRVYGEGFDITTNWPSVRRVGRRFGAIQFWTGPSGSIAVPLSAFPSLKAAQDFQNQATVWWTADRKINA